MGEEKFVQVYKPMQNFFSLHQSTKKYPLFSLQAFVFQLIDELNQLSPDHPPPPSLPRQSSVADRRCITLQIPVHGPMLTSAKSSLCVIYFPLYMYNVSPGNGPLTIVKCKIRLATSSLSLSLSLLNRPNPTVTIFNRSLIRKTQNKTTNCTNLCINIGCIAETILRKEPWHICDLLETPPPS